MALLLRRGNVPVSTLLMDPRHIRLPFQESSTAPQDDVRIKVPAWSLESLPPRFLGSWHATAAPCWCTVRAQHPTYFTRLMLNSDFEPVVRNFPDRPALPPRHRLSTTPSDSFQASGPQ